MPRDVVVLLSGGLDSTVLATMALRSNALHSVVSYSYGAPHGYFEGLAASWWAKEHNVRRVVCELPMVGVDNAMRLGAGEEGPRVLPGRNLLFLAHAVNYAAAHACREVWFGATADDQADYPDCREAFVLALSSLSEADCGVSVRAPLIGETKSGVVRLARNLHVDIAATWSCYEPDGIKQCGTCNACALRITALATT